MSSYIENEIPNVFVEDKMLVSPSGMPVKPRIIPSSTNTWEKKEGRWIDPTSGYTFYQGVIEFTDLKSGKTYNKENPFNQ